MVIPYRSNHRLRAHLATIPLIEGISVRRAPVSKIVWWVWKFFNSARYLSKVMGSARRSSGVGDVDMSDSE